MAVLSITFWDSFLNTVYLMNKVHAQKVMCQNWGNYGQKKELIPL